MGSTNFTPNYNLPQFIGTDKPAWLTDVNTAFSNIDTAIKNAADDASSAVSTAGSASSAAAGAVNSVNTLDTQINTPGTGLAAQVTAQGTAITNIGNTIGTTPLTTVAQTLTGAIEEVKGSIPASTGIVKLLNVQTISESYNGVKTIGQALDALYSALVAQFAALQPNECIRIVGATYRIEAQSIIPYGDQSFKTSVPVNVPLFGGVISATNVYLLFCVLKAGSTYRNVDSSFTIIDLTSSTPASGTAQLIIEKYKIEQ